jgi:predicted 3-demethylubiquinone-9 3-methyltransferase (glyoxalase superfamily)
VKDVLNSRTAFFPFEVSDGAGHHTGLFNRDQVMVVALSTFEAAANLYVSIFKDAKLLGVTRYGDAGPGPKGTVMTATFSLFGMEFVALNAGPLFKFNESISFVVNCDSQEEIDYYWEKLITGGGAPSMCGWLKDKFGLSWQISPRMLDELAQTGEPAGVDRMMRAMLKMQKLDIARLKQAYDGA